MVSPSLRVRPCLLRTACSLRLPPPEHRRTLHQDYLAVSVLLLPVYVPCRRRTTMATVTIRCSGAFIGSDSASRPASSIKSTVKSRDVIIFSRADLCWKGNEITNVQCTRDITYSHVCFRACKDFHACKPHFLHCCCWCRNPGRSSNSLSSRAISTTHLSSFTWQ